LRRAKPDFGFRRTPNGANQSTEPALTERPNNSEGGFVREIVAEKSNRGAGTFFIKDRRSGSALIAAHTQLKAGFEVEQRKSIEPGKGLKELSSPALDALSHLAWPSSPVHDGAVGLVFKQSAQ
jgi:hypothetical protein